MSQKTVAGAPNKQNKNIAIHLEYVLFLDAILSPVCDFEGGEETVDDKDVKKYERQSVHCGRLSSAERASTAMSYCTAERCSAC